MKKNDYLEKANFRTLIEAEGKDRIQDKLNIIGVFLDSEEHITLEEMLHLLREKGYDFEPRFVNAQKFGDLIQRMGDLGGKVTVIHEHLIHPGHAECERVPHQNAYANCF